MLRIAGPEVFDKWVSHEIPFNSADPTKALDAVGDYLKNPKYVNGGFGDVTSIASTAFQDGGLPILDGQCSLHRQASFYAANWPEGTKVAEDGDVFAFYLPGVTADDHPVLGAGEFVTAFADRPEVKALQTSWSTDTWANLKAKASSEDTGGGWITANKGLDTEPAATRSTCSRPRSCRTRTRCSASTARTACRPPRTPPFWKEATNWITGQDDEDTLDKIEAAWPTS